MVGTRRLAGQYSNKVFQILRPRVIIARRRRWDNIGARLIHTDSMALANCSVVGNPESLLYVKPCGRIYPEVFEGAHWRVCCKQLACSLYHLCARLVINVAAPN